MVADGLLTRQRYREVPPRVDYELTERSRQLMPVLGALARWGYEWTWSAPRPSEEVNIGAIFRLAPGLLAPPRTLDGTVECVVLGQREQPDRAYILRAGEGRVEVSERSADDPDARVSGPPSAWVQALGPEGSFAELEVSGARELAEAVLRGFVRAANSGSASAAA